MAYDEKNTIYIKKRIALEIARAEIILRGRITETLEEEDFGDWEGDIEIHLDIHKISD